MNSLRKYVEIQKDGAIGTAPTSQHVMSLIEDNALLPLFSNTDFPDLSASGLVPDSPSRFAFLKKASGGFLTNSQAITEEPLFSLFLSGGIAGLDESLLAGIVPDASVPKMEHNPIPRQYMSIVPDAHTLDVNLVPQLPIMTPTTPPANPAAGAPNNKAAGARRGSDANSRKRKFIQAPNMKTEGMGAEQPLSPEEERNMKRQRRLVKNREAAQLFRQRQKAYIQDLEKKVGDLTATNNEFRARVELLNSENKLIKEQLLYLRNFVTQAVSFSFPKVGNMPAAPPGMPTVGGIPAGLASLALGNLASSPSLQGSMASMLNAVTGPLPPGILGSLPMSSSNMMSSMSSPAAVHHMNSTLPPSSSLPPNTNLPTPPHTPTINIIPPQSQSQPQTQPSQPQPQPQHLPTPSLQQPTQQAPRPLSPVITIDPTLSPTKTAPQVAPTTGVAKK